MDEVRGDTTVAVTYGPVDEAAVRQVLAAYRREQFRDHLTGPLASFVVHAGLLALLCVCVVRQPRRREREVLIDVTPQMHREVHEKAVPPSAEPMGGAVQAPAVTLPEYRPEPSAGVLETVGDDAPASQEPGALDATLLAVGVVAPVPLAGPFTGRLGRGRQQLGTRFHDTAASREAIRRALAWLASVQRQNGSWQDDPAHSGLALLCFLGFGQTQATGEFADTVRGAMGWLSANMPEGRAWSRAYSHGIATYALAEAYGMAQVPSLRVAMDHGIETILRGQQPGGGFDYHYRQGERWDLSVTGWQMQAMKAAWVSGCTVSGLEDAMAKVIRFTKQAYRGEGDNAGTFGYNSPGGAANLTGVGTLGLQLLGEKKCREAVGGGKFLMETRLPQYQKAAADWSIADKCMYGWYYDTQAVFQQQGAEWRKWNTVFQPILVSKQHPKGFWQLGSSHFGGTSTEKRILATTFACLQLEVYYRYLPTLRLNRTPPPPAGGLADATVGDSPGIVVQ